MPYAEQNPLIRPASAQGLSAIGPRRAHGLILCIEEDMSPIVRLLRAAALAASMTAISAYGSLPAAEPAPPAPPSPGLSREPLDLGPDLTDFYRDRGFKPLWIAGSQLRPEARQLLSLLPADGALQRAVRASASGDRYALTRADLLLTKAFADHLSAIDQAPAVTRMHYVDEELRPGDPPLRSRLDQLASAADRGPLLSTLRGRNPAFDGLRRGFDIYRAQWSRLPQMQLARSAPAASLGRRVGVSGGTALAERLREFQRVHGLRQSGRADAGAFTALNRGTAYYERLI